MKQYEHLKIKVIYLTDDVLTNSREQWDFSKDGTVTDGNWAFKS